MFVGEHCVFVGEKRLFLGEKRLFLGEHCVFVGEQCLFLEEQCLFAREHCLFAGHPDLYRVKPSPFSEHRDALAVVPWGPREERRVLGPVHCAFAGLLDQEGDDLPPAALAPLHGLGVAPEVVGPAARLDQLRLEPCSNPRHPVRAFSACGTATLCGP